MIEGIITSSSVGSSKTSHMSQSLRFACLVLALLGSHTESSPQAFVAPLKTFNLEELIPLRPDFYPNRLAVDWISDTEYIFSEPGVGIRKYDAATNEYVPILDPVELNNLSKYAVSGFSKDTKYLLLNTNRIKIYRYSSIAEYAVLDLDNKSLIPLAAGLLQAVVWGKDKSLAYVQDNNVYYLPDSTKPQNVIALTSQGVPGEVYFGVTDWIYEEEVFNAAEALWFSTKGTYLAIASFNDTLVDSALYPIYGHPADARFQYPQEERFKYPKAGRANPVVGLRVYKVDDLKSEAWNIPAPVDVVGLDHILGRVNWASDSNVVVLWLNRRQSISVLVNCDLALDKCSIVKQQVEENGWIDINEPLFSADGNKMVQVEPQYFGEKRLLHATIFDFNTLVTEDLTPLNSTVTDVVGWNQKTNTLYYVISPENIPWQRQLWASTNGESMCVSCKESTCRSVSAMFSTAGSYAIVSCSASNVPHRTYLYNAKVDTFTLIKDNPRLTKKLSQYYLPMPLFNIISLGEDVNAHVKLLLPPNMDKGQKYPMIVRIYAGPGTSRVKDSYELEYYGWYLAANRSVIVASIDVRGSGAMGVDAMFAVNRALGTVEVTDTLAAIRKLTSLYSFIDGKRIGVWGWSYGGFATTMMLIKDEQKTIACGAAVAPVTSWLYYDTIYTERYLDTPQENPSGYQRSDVMASAEKLRGRRYLLVHGTGDDNVHYQNSLQLAKELQHADIEFEQMSYTDETHSLLGVSRHFYHTLDHFWTECFRS